MGYRNLTIIGTIFVFLLSRTLTGNSQNFLTLQGKVRDASNGKPLDHASVTIAGKGIGTMTNEEGRFEFNIPEAFRNDTLSVSFIGFNTYHSLINSLSTDSEISISCTPSVMTLAAVNVIGEPCNVDCLISKVLKAYDKNYRTRPFAIDGFYRETRKKNNEYGYLLEAACDIFKTSYKDEPIVELQKVRNSFMKDETGLNTEENFLGTLLKNDYVSNPFMGFYRRYSKKTKFIMVDTTILNHVPVYVISTGELPNWKQTFSISSDDYSIIRFEGETNYGFTEIIPKANRNQEFRYRHLKVINEFTHVDGAYFLTRLKMVLDGDNFAGDYMVLDREFVANLINTVTPRPAPDSKLMKSIKLEAQVTQYDSVFWEHYNLVLRTPDQEKLIHDLENHTALKDQFKRQAPTTKKKTK